LGKDLKRLIERTVPVEEYIKSLSDPFKSRFVERKETYRLKGEVVKELERYKDKILVVVFSSEWCKDCAANVPILVLLAGKAGLNVRVFGGLKRDPLNPHRKWRIPPPRER